MPGGIGSDAPCKVERDETSERDEDATTRWSSSGEQREEEEGEDATPARQESRRSRSPTIGHHRGPTKGWPLRPWSPAPKRRLRASERASFVQDDLSNPLHPSRHLCPFIPLFPWNRYIYLLSTARPIRAQAKQGILMRHAMRLQRNFDAYDTCRTSSRRVRLVITHGLMSPRSKICHCHVSDITWHFHGYRSRELKILFL